MGIKTFIREIRQEIRDEGRAEGYDKALNDLRAMPPHEVLAKLGHRNGDSELEHPNNGDTESEHHDNGKSPQD